MSTITMTTNLSAATPAATRKSSHGGLAIAFAAALLVGGMAFVPAWLGNAGPSTQTMAPAATAESHQACTPKAAEMTDLSLWQLSHPLFRPCTSGFDLVPHIGLRRTACSTNP